MKRNCVFLTSQFLGLASRKTLAKFYKDLQSEELANHDEFKHGHLQGQY